MNAEYNYEIRVREIKPPLGRFFYAAKPIGVYRRKDGKFQEVGHSFYEHWV